MPDIVTVGSRLTEQDTVNDLTALLPAGLIKNDDVFVLTATRNTVNNAWSEASGLWAPLADLYSNDSRDCNFSLFYKKMLDTPDADVTIHQNGTAAGMAAIAKAYRGSDVSTPFDVVGLSNAGINGANINPLAITTITNRALVIACGCASIGGGAITTPPSGYGDETIFTATVTNLVLAIASKLIPVAGPEDPGVFTVSTSGTSDSWCSFTAALRPTADIITTLFGLPWIRRRRR